MADESIHGEQNTAVETNEADRSTAQVLLEYGKTVLITLLVAMFLKTFVVEAFRIPSGSMENTLLIGDFLLVNKFAYGLRSPRYFPLTNMVVPSFAVPLFSQVRRGDVVVFEFPGSRDEIQPGEPVNYIKRCVGIPGDAVEIRKGEVFVNGTWLSFPKEGRAPSRPEGAYWHRSYETFPAGAGFTDVNYGPIQIPKKGDTVLVNKESVNRWRTLIAREGHRIRIAQNGDMSIDGESKTKFVVGRNYYFMMGDNRDNSMDSRYWGFVPEENLVGEALFVYWSWDPEVSVASVSEKLSSIRWERIGKLIR